VRLLAVIGLRSRADTKRVGCQGRVAPRRLLPGAKRIRGILRAHPAQEDAQIGLLQTLRETGAYGEACKRGDEFLNTSASSGGLQFERGRAARTVGDYAGAEEHLRRSLAMGTTRRAASAELARFVGNAGAQGRSR